MKKPFLSPIMMLISASEHVLLGSGRFGRRLLNSFIMSLYRAGVTKRVRMRSALASSSTFCSSAMEQPAISTMPIARSMIGDIQSLTSMFRTDCRHPDEIFLHEYTTAQARIRRRVIKAIKQLSKPNAPESDDIKTRCGYFGRCGGSGGMKTST